ncbi:hypothetical protein EIP86_010971 [Pleurotus ostreatoroseus]|nr:hypothetical protein EIP86_010971 [Pleurotus ostreatoroseus]
MASAQAEATPTLSSVIQICYLISSVDTRASKDVLRAWREMFRSATALINQISLAHDIDRCDAREHGETCAAAYALLKEIEYKEIEYHEFLEHKAYKTWKAEEDDWVPDTFLSALLPHVCDAHTQDEEGHTFWRVQRVREQPAQQIKSKETTAAVPVRVKQVETQSWELRNPLTPSMPPYTPAPLLDADGSLQHSLPAPPMDSDTFLRNVAGSFRPGVTSVDVVPADGLPSQSTDSGNTAEKEAVSVANEPSSEGTTISTQRPTIEPAPEEYVPSSAVDINIGVTLTVHPVDRGHATLSAVPPQPVERSTAPVISAEPNVLALSVESPEVWIVPAASNNSSVIDATQRSLTVASSEEPVTNAVGVAAAAADETVTEVVQAGRADQVSSRRASPISPHHSQLGFEPTAALVVASTIAEGDRNDRVGSGDPKSEPPS